MESTRPRASVETRLAVVLSRVGGTQFLWYYGPTENITRLLLGTKSTPHQFHGSTSLVLGHHQGKGLSWNSIGHLKCQFST